jgi:hypothetical protein
MYIHTRRSPIEQGLRILLGLLALFDTYANCVTPTRSSGVRERDVYYYQHSRHAQGYLTHKKTPTPRGSPQAWS